MAQAEGSRRSWSRARPPPPQSHSTVSTGFDAPSAWAVVRRVCPLVVEHKVLVGPGWSQNVGFLLLAEPTPVELARRELEVEKMAFAQGAEVTQLGVSAILVDGQGADEERLQEHREIVGDLQALQCQLVAGMEGEGQLGQGVPVVRPLLEACTHRR